MKREDLRANYKLQEILLTSEPTARIKICATINHWLMIRCRQANDRRLKERQAHVEANLQRGLWWRTEQLSGLYRKHLELVGDDQSVYHV